MKRKFKSGTIGKAELQRIRDDMSRGNTVHWVAHKYKRRVALIERSITWGGDAVATPKPEVTTTPFDESGYVVVCDSLYGTGEKVTGFDTLTDALAFVGAHVRDGATLYSRVAIDLVATVRK